MMNDAVRSRLRHPLRARYLILPGVVAWALLVRLHGLDAASMWMDELRQISYYHGSWRTVMYNAAAQAQTPLDYWIGRCVALIGTSDFLLRLPAACCGTLAVLATFLLARRLVSPAAAGLAACVVASAPYAVHYSQEARPYAIFWCLQLLTLLALARAWRINGWVDWILFAGALGACLLSRTLAPLAFSAGIAAWSGLEVWRGRHVRRRASGRSVAWWRRRSVRLWTVLVVLWIPVVQLLLYIVRVQRRRAYLADAVAEALDWQENLVTLGHIIGSWWVFTLPIGIVLVPLAAWGAVLMLQRRGRGGRDGRLLVVSAGVGYVVHVAIYVVMVAGVEPKHVYWAYMLPFCAVAAAVAVERLAGRLRGAVVPLWCRAALYLAIACALMTMTWIDRRSAVFDKPDWRGAAHALQAKLAAGDLAFYHDATVFGVYRPACMAAPHYWPAGRPLIDLADAAAAIERVVTADGAVRVGVMLRCPAHMANDHRRWRRVCRDAGLHVRRFERFVVLVSIVPQPPGQAFDQLTAAVARALAEQGGVELHAVRAAWWKRHGDTTRCAAERARARALVSAAQRDRLEARYGPMWGEPADALAR